jgi:hypothetical protein
VRRRAAGLALVAIAAASHADAQRIRGALTDSSTHERVPAAVVVLYDSVGHGLARVMANGEGQYSIVRPPNTRTMRVLRIGYRPRDFTVGKADSVVDVRMQPVPSLLGTIQAVDRPFCSNADEGNSALDLWEQARAGLMASLVSREMSPPRIRLRTYRRTLDPTLNSIVTDSIQYRNVVDGRSFVAARPAWVFAEYGYMREDHDGREFYAPDESVLLDPTFAETHCLRAIDGHGPRESQVGIAFDPIQASERDTIVDLAGALWLDRKTYAPHDIEFRYTNLERAGRDAGGEVEFSVMPNGVSMINQWQIRSTIVAYDQPAVPTGLARRTIPRRDRYTTRVLGYQHIGGAIASASWADGKRWQGNLPHIQGVVVDADSAPVANAVVWLFDGRDTVHSGADGRFTFPPMEPGLYTVLASDSALAIEGIYRSSPVTTVVLASQGANVVAKLHPRTEVLPTVCPANSYRPNSGVLFARVVDSLGVGVPTAQIEVETVARGDTTAATRTRQTRMGVTGEDGRFVICGADFTQRLIVRAYKQNRGAGIAIDSWGDEVLSLSLKLKPLKS